MFIFKSQTFLSQSFDYILNLGVFSAASLYLSAPNLGLACVSGTIVLITFIGIAALHIWKVLRKKLVITKAIEKVKLIIEKKKKEAVENTSVDLHQLTDNFVVNLENLSCKLVS